MSLTLNRLLERGRDLDTAIVVPNGVRLSYGQLRKQVSSAADEPTRLEGRPDELLKRQDFEELFLGAETTLPAVDEEDNDNR